jgi:hypothetical protein
MRVRRCHSEADISSPNTRALLDVLAVKRLGRRLSDDAPTCLRPRKTLTPGRLDGHVVDGGESGMDVDAM